MIKKNIPNLLTLGNLFCGCMAVVAVLQPEIFQFKLGGKVVSGFSLAFALVFMAGIFDFLDGFVARLLKVHSEIGKQLDSLADMVTFGLVPGIIMFEFLKIRLVDGNLPESLALVAFLIPLLSAVRLAKFNIATDQSSGFIGIPTPANAFFFAPIPVLFGGMMAGSITSMGGIFPFLFHPYTLLVLVVLMSLMMVAPVPMLAFKFKHFKWSGNQARFILLLCIPPVAIFCLLKTSVFAAIPILILLYILISIGDNFRSKSSHEIQS